MKQGIRFVTKPGQFFNQLQWSSNHWWIIAAFFALATVETQIGRHHHLYSAFASVLTAKFGLNHTLSLWMIMATRLAMLLLGAVLISTLIYLVGAVIGRANSRRVLFRRLAVVFTVFLAGLTANHFGAEFEWARWVSWALCGWSLFLGYIAIRAQFELSHLETVMVSLFALLLVSTTWQFSNRAFETAVTAQMHELAAKPAKTPLHRVR